jgi:hypothetical protein
MEITGFLRFSHSFHNLSERASERAGGRGAKALAGIFNGS